MENTPVRIGHLGSERVKVDRVQCPSATRTPIENGGNGEARIKPHLHASAATCRTIAQINVN
jgi:hypothetical protein